MRELEDEEGYYATPPEVERLEREVEALTEKLRKARMAKRLWKKLAKLLWAPAPDWEKRALAAEAKLRRAGGRDG